MVVTNQQTPKTIKFDKIIHQKIKPRKIRIVIMNGLSLNIINSLRSEHNLLNFNYLLKKGVSGKFDLFKPNLNLSLLNTTFTGKLPSQLPYHSNYKFKFRNIKKEFNVFPRYIFFRYSSKLKFSYFYKSNDAPVIDIISKYYIKNGYKTQSLINPAYVPTYFSENLLSNTKFIKHFSEISKNNKDTKFNLLKKSFFYDDYIKKRIINLKDSEIYYSVIKFNGLDIISKYFYQFYLNNIFGNIDKGDINRYKWVLKKYYEFYDSIVGNLISSMGDDELLVLLSLYEYEPLPVWRRILANFLGNREVYMYKTLNSKGTIFLYEKNAIKKGYPIQKMSIFDFFPTMLYYSKFNLSKDLNGKIIREIFLDDFLLNNPIDIRTESNN
jgi:predicted AlkP superfamily phosphohydrolase/phosphomutase